MKKFGVLAVTVALCFSFIAPVFANEPKDKISRGIVNVLTSVLEVPQNIDIEWKQSKNAAIGIFAGLFKGLFWGVSRCASGFWDLVTFPFPKPDNYNSVIQPEYVQRGIQTHFISDEQKAK